MSIMHPDDAEDQMAWVPILGCCVPIALVVIAILIAVFR
jgi:hypothetical protein